MTLVSRNELSDVFRSAMEATHDPSMAAADWLARDIDPEQPSVVALLTNPKTTVEALRKAKDAFKTMRILGERSADRRLAARLYAATIASAIVHHDARISRQSDAALRRGLEGNVGDANLPEGIRKLCGAALCVLG